MRSDVSMDASLLSIKEWSQERDRPGLSAQRDGQGRIKRHYPKKARRLPNSYCQATDNPGAVILRASGPCKL